MIKLKNRQIGAAGFVANKIMENAISKFKQETLEAAAEKKYPLKGELEIHFYMVRRLAFINGAKWQSERMYSEKEQLNLLNKYNEYLFTFIDKDVVGIGVEEEDVIKWFEQFKKK
jgi:hypothetical protein